MALLDDLAEGARAATGNPGVCPACVFAGGYAGTAEFQPLVDALAGTIGVRRLVEILRPHGANFGRRTIERHRNERHFQ